MKKQLLVKLEWDDDLGECWMNTDNLKSCLFSEVHTKPELLDVDVQSVGLHMCCWSRADNDTDCWETSCGKAIMLDEGVSDEVKYCCYCGLEMEVDTQEAGCEPCQSDSPGRG